MPNPLDTNDEWAEFARELERDKPPATPPADMVERRIEAEAVEPHHGTDARVEDEVVAEGEPEAAADEEFDDADEGAPAGAEGENGADGQPGTGRKRRRRRRRRRKGGCSPEAAVAGDASAEVAEGEADAEPAPAEEPAPEGDDFGSDDTESELMPLAAEAEEDTASEVLRDLIATWNVPSWDDIVGGLYRPDR